MAAENDKGGYDVEFVNKEKDVTCSICLFVLREPMQAEQCGHRFCKSCIDDLRNSQGIVLTCPEDRKEINVFNDRGKEREILNCLIKCPNYKKYCGWTSELRELNKHLSVCVYQIVVCNNQGCQENIPRKEMKIHSQLQCVYRITECVYCSMACQYFHLTEHFVTCEKYPICCENGCGKIKIPRNEMQHHLSKNCPKVLHLCQYEDIGCEETATFDCLDSHMKEATESHLRYAVQIIKKQSQQIESQSQQLETQSNKLEAQAIQIAEESASNKQQVAALNHQLTSVLEKLQGLDNLRTINNVTKGFLEWKMENLNKKFQGAKRGNNAHTRTFFALNGYKCRISIHLNGEGEYRNKYISIFFALEEGTFDDALKWPMRAILSFCIMKNGQEMINHSFNTFQSNEIIKYFLKPTDDNLMNRNGIGYQEFVSHDQMFNYIASDDSVTFKITVDPM